MTNDLSIPELLEQLGRRREAAIQEVRRCEQAIAALNASSNPTKAEVWGEHGQLRQMAKHIDRRTLLMNLKDSIKEFIKMSDGAFGMKGLRTYLENTKKFEKHEMMLPVTTVMRELIREKFIDVVEQGKGRKQGVYRKHKEGESNAPQ